ncbi:MAG: glycoside hydrolase family 16 protein [Moraxellaceae bacterium]|nr:MAG: glycoside hydrolase family 16 protein [Moraxellaceae bacterium]
MKSSSSSIVSSSSSSVTNSDGVPAGYKLVWADEFDKNGLPDSTKWVYDTEANATGWYNNEKQYYAVRNLDYSEVKDGKLTITARKTALTSEPDYGGQAYTSARLITNGKATWTYGYYETRAKLPCGKGSWPAIWMLGLGEWPASGEIDIMEQVGSNPTSIEGTIWTLAQVGTHGDGGTIRINDACSVFHNYQLTWTPESLVIAIDNKPYHTYKNSGNGPSVWPFDKPMYFLLNLALGGDMGGPIDDSIFPIKYEIEYVRVYQKQ